MKKHNLLSRVVEHISDVDQVKRQTVGWCIKLDIRLINILIFAEGKLFGLLSTVTTKSFASASVHSAIQTLTLGNSAMIPALTFINIISADYQSCTILVRCFGIASVSKVHNRILQSHIVQSRPPLPTIILLRNHTLEDSNQALQ